jgi:predicted nuclease with TOPRIM domain
MKNTILKIGLFALAVVLLVGMSIKISLLQKEKERLKQNTEALMSGAKYYENKFGESTAEVNRLNLTVSELQDNRAALVQEVKNMDIKLKRLQSISNTSLVSEFNSKLTLHDTIIVRDTFIDTVQCASYKDEYIDVNVCDFKDEIYANIITYDTIIQVVHRVPKKWWFIKYGTKAIRQTIKSSSPYTKITYTEYIEIKK